MIISNLITKVKNHRATKQLYKDLYAAFCDTDYSNYEIGVAYNAEEKNLFIPKPVMALSLVDEDLMDWICEQIDSYPIESVLVA